MRGVGKIVLILQLAKEVRDSVYFSADSTILKPFSIYEIVTSLKERGFKTIFIDDIHKKSNWQEDIKTLYDEHEVRIFFSGSSTIDILHSSSDLSRRVVLKELRPASFREYLNIKRNFKIPVFSFETILNKKKGLARKYAECLNYFEEYLQYGGYFIQRTDF